jgi:hypothetical protein
MSRTSAALRRAHRRVLPAVLLALLPAALAAQETHAAHGAPAPAAARPSGPAGLGATTTA